LRSADFNKDGLPDIVTTNLDDGTVTILLGDGKGGLHQSSGSPFQAGAKPWEVAIDDVNGDGTPDLLIVPYERDIHDASQDAVTVLLGDGKGGFVPMRGSPLLLHGCHGPDSVTGGDLRGNGSHDIIVACAESKNLMIFEPGRDGRFISSSQPFKGGWGSVTSAHLGVGHQDELITANNDDGTITVFFAK